MTCTDYARFLADPTPFTADERVAIIQHAGTCPTCLELAFAKFGEAVALEVAELQTERLKAESDQYAEVVQRGKRLPSPDLNQDPAFAAFVLSQLEAERDTLRRVAGELYAALKSLAFRHGWIPQGGPCVCDEHAQANAVLASAALILNPPATAEARP